MGKKRYVRIIAPAYLKEWLNRSKRENTEVDIIDKFTCLWIAFNGWMKGQYGEKKTDNSLIKETAKNEELKKCYDDLIIKNIGFKKLIGEYTGVEVVNMKYIKDDLKLIIFDGTFNSYINILYQTRCNLFHGRKCADENTNDHKLTEFAFNSFSVLFDEFLNTTKYFEEGI